MPFKVTTWDPSRGTGRLLALDLDVSELEVERAHLRVDDLIVGEEVDAVFEEDDNGALVARDVTPVRWRENALPIPVDATRLPEALEATIQQVSAMFSKHTRLVTVAAEEDRLRLEVHDVDWPPPITPPLASISFEGVAYVKLRPFSEDVACVSAVPWASFRSARARMLRHWSLATEDVPDDAFVFRFEPARYSQTASYVIASAVAFTRGGKR